MERPESPYTAIELKSYLPNGWRFADGFESELEWTPKPEAWRGRMLDPADQAWDFTVPADVVGSGERLEVLRRAIDRVYREALG